MKLHVILLITTCVVLANSTPLHKTKSSSIKKHHRSNIEVIPETFDETKPKSTHIIHIVKKSDIKDDNSPLKRTARQSNIHGQKTTSVKNTGPQIRAQSGPPQQLRRDSNRRPVQYKPVVHNSRPAVRPIHHNVRQVTGVRPSISLSGHHPSAVYSHHGGVQNKPIHTPPRPIRQETKTPQQQKVAKPSNITPSNPDRFAGGRSILHTLAQ